MDAAPIRKRLKRRDVPGGIRFITFSCQRRLPLLTNPAISELLLTAIARARSVHQFELVAWVLMPEHVHLLMRPRDDIPLERTLKSIKLAVSKSVIARWRNIGATHILTKLDDGTGSPRFWQKGGGFDRNVRDEHELSREIRYIHHNPVRRGLVQRPEDYRFSSIHWWIGDHTGPLNCDPLPDPAWSQWKGFA